MEEIWIVYKDVYSISNYGNVKNNKTQKILKGTLTKGYKMVHLTINGKTKKIAVHRLVAKLFIPNPKNLPQVNHIDGIKHNSHMNNLEWCTSKENMEHAVKTGLINEITQGGKSVIQKTADGKVINIFNSISGAARAVDGANEHICAVCKGKRKTAYGYIWEYKI